MSEHDVQVEARKRKQAEAAAKAREARRQREEERDRLLGEIAELQDENSRLRREVTESLGQAVKSADDAADARRELETYAPLPAELRGVIALWFRSEVRKHHPDRSGSKETTAALIEARDSLLALLAKGKK
jgi:hypothetical protein